MFFQLYGFRRNACTAGHETHAGRVERLGRTSYEDLSSACSISEIAHAQRQRTASAADKLHMYMLMLPGVPLPCEWMTRGTVHDGHLHLIGVHGHRLRFHGLTAWNVPAL